MPRPGEDRSDVGGASFGPVPLSPINIGPGPVPLSPICPAFPISDPSRFPDRKPGQSLTGVLSALLSAATPLEMAEESRFLGRTVTRSRTFKPFWHMLLWPDSRTALRESSGLDVNSSRQSHFPA